MVVGGAGGGWGVRFIEECWFGFRAGVSFC